MISLYNTYSVRQTTTTINCNLKEKREKCTIAVFGNTFLIKKLI